MIIVVLGASYGSLVGIGATVLGLSINANFLVADRCFGQLTSFDWSITCKVDLAHPYLRFQLLKFVTTQVDVFLSRI